MMATHARIEPLIQYEYHATDPALSQYPGDRLGLAGDYSAPKGLTGKASGMECRK